MPSTFNQDYADPLNGPAGRRRRPAPRREEPVFSKSRRNGLVAGRLTLPPQLRALGLGLLTAAASAAFAGFGGATFTPPTQHMSLSVQPGLSPPGHADLPNPLAFARPDKAETPTPSRSAWTSYTVRPGETLSQLGQRTGLGSPTAMALARACAEVYPARRMRAGHSFRIRKDGNGEPAAIRYQIDDRRFLAWQPQGEGQDGFAASIEKYPRTVQVQEAFGRIETSLFEAGREAGLSDKTTMELARIFGWDIDFAHDIRRGDWFRVLYREIYRDGEKVANGPILAAEFVVQGESHRAVRFTDARGRTDYFHPDGRSVRKAFLRSPVRFDRITSGFSRGRKHPILGRRRAHEGVDYGARTGTPVRTTGDGRVIFRGRKGGYGRVVKIRHAGRFTTVYAHLSRFAHIRRGERVKQGQTIGYVGQSGLATGPHLHYEFQVHGRPRNPLKVDLPQAEPLAKKYRDEFGARSHHYAAWLESVGPARVRVAQQNEGGSAS